MIINAHAKINLTLDVVGKRPDGYHELKTVFYEMPLHDILEFSRTEDKGIKIECSDRQLPTGEENLVYKAAKLLFDGYRLDGGLKVYIEKNIPYGAGLGGGSSDAAAALKAVNELYGLKLSDEELKKYAACIGADVPFFISGGAAYAGGIGEKLEPLGKVEIKPVVLAKPVFGVSTVSAYRAVDSERCVFHPDVDSVVEGLKSGRFEDVYQNIGNSFEIPVFRLYPEIGKIKEAFLASGARASAMTGSGSAVFAVFANENEAFAAAQKIKARFDGIAVFLNNGERI
jgi:4-diphosphocytidyl-2-C-methyl-D-erythritol kinase